MIKVPEDIRNKITPAPIRQIVQVRFPDGRAFDGPVGTPVEAFIQVADLRYRAESSPRWSTNCASFHTSCAPTPTSCRSARPIRTACASTGARSAFCSSPPRRVFPDRTVSINHSMPFGGYCEARGGDPLNDAELGRLRRMRELIDAICPSPSFACRWRRRCSSLRRSTTWRRPTCLPGGARIT